MWKVVEVDGRPNVAKPGWLRDQRKLWRDGGQVRSDTNEKLTNSQSANTLIWLIWHICKVTHYSFTITIFDWVYISLQFGNSPKICLRFNVNIFTLLLQYLPSEMGINKSLRHSAHKLVCLKCFWNFWNSSLMHVV